MIKKLNKERISKGLRYFPDWYKTSSDYLKISLHASDISIILKELKSKSTLNSLRLRHALLFDIPKQKKAELRLQKRILDQHIDKIDKLLEANDQLRDDNYEREYGEKSLNGYKFFA